MTLLAANALASFLPVLLLLACPLMMIFMMRGMHGGHGHGRAGHGAAGQAGCHGGGDEQGEQPRSRAAMSLDELKQERDELNALIGERAEQAVAARR